MKSPFPCPVTSNLALAEAPGNVRVAKTETGLPGTSVVNVSQVLTIDKALPTARVRPLPAAALAQADNGLRQVISL